MRGNVFCKILIAVATLVAMVGVPSHAATPRIEAMIPVENVPVTTLETPIYRGIGVGEIEGEDKESDPLGLLGPQLDREDFREVLRRSLERANLLNTSEDAPYRLNARLVGVVSTAEPYLGATGYTVIRYKLRRSSNNEIVFDDVVMRKEEKNSLFSMASRRKVLEGSVRANVSGLLAGLHSLTPSKAPLAGEQEETKTRQTEAAEGGDLGLLVGNEKDVGAGSPLAATPPYSQGITIGVVESGAAIEKDELGLIGHQLDGGEFREALRLELEQQGLLSVEEPANYVLNVKIISGTSFRKPGLNYVGYTVIRYRLSRSDDRKVVLDEVLERETEATLSEAFVGGKRSRKALNVAVRENISGFIDRLRGAATLSGTASRATTTAQTRKSVRSRQGRRRSDQPIGRLVGLSPRFLPQPAPMQNLGLRNAGR